MTDVYNKWIAGEYKNTLPYPDAPARPKLGSKPTSEEARAYAEALDKYDVLVKAYNVKRNEYHTQTYELETKLRADLEEENEVVGNPKAGRLWDIAWDRGHSGGYGEVISNYNELVDLIK
jgi:hypothetical protein